MAIPAFQKKVEPEFDIDNPPLVIKGPRLLVRMLEIEEMSEGGILLTPTIVQQNTTANIVGQVLKMGSLAYKDQKRYPTPEDAYCKVGDWITFKAYSGERAVVGGIEYRIMFDDSVQAVTDRPELIKMVGVS